MAAQPKVELFSGRVKKVAARDIMTKGYGTGKSRYEVRTPGQKQENGYLKLSEAEPNLFVPWRSVNPETNIATDADPAIQVGIENVLYPTIKVNGVDVSQAPADSTLRAMLVSDKWGNRTWSNKIALDANDNMIINSNLFVNGTTVEVNTVQTTIDDPIITIGGDNEDLVSELNGQTDRGIEFRWWDPLADEGRGAAKLGFFGFKASTRTFTFIPSGRNENEIFIGDSGTSEGAFEVPNLSTQNIFTPTDVNLRIAPGGSGTVIIESAITQGTWRADVIDVGYGGTGRVELQEGGILFGNGDDPVGVTNPALANGSLLQSDLGGRPYFSNIIDCGRF
ncbi:MAG: hypothetical protein EBT86_03410 [Actinobacteria bacterium]|nr:hypothetical protein [Actinomycetota bacterium]